MTNETMPPKVEETTENKPETSSGLISIEDVFTRKRSETPKTVDFGVFSVDVLGTASDAFYEAKSEVQRLIFEGTLAQEDYESYVVAKIIVGWTFKEECTFENAFKLCKESPQLRDMLDREASKHSNFMENVGLQKS